MNNIFSCRNTSSSGILLLTAGQWLPLLGRRQSTMKNSGHCCKTSSKQPSMGIMSVEKSRAGFPLPFSQFLPSSILLLDSGLQFYHRHIHAGLLSETAMRPPSCHVMQEHCRPSVSWPCWLVDRKDVQSVKGTATTTSKVLGTSLIWSKSGEMGRWNKKQVCVCVYCRYLT